MKTKNLFLLFVVLLNAGFLKAQPDFIRQTEKHLFGTDTIVYPFRGGVQMIEIDHIGKWNREIYYLEQSQPRAMPHSMFHPQPPGNEYFFRNSSNEVIRLYNTSLSAAEATQLFKNKKENTASPLNSKSESSMIWPYDSGPLFSFGGYYKIFKTDSFVLRGNAERNMIADMPYPSAVYSYGLIDSAGIISIPCMYQDILPLGKNILVKKNNHVGVSDKNGKTIIDCLYDRYDSYYLDQSARYISFIRDQQYQLVFDTQSGKITPLNNYDKVFDLQYVHQNKFALVKKGEKFGLLDTTFTEVLAPECDEIHRTFHAGFAVFKKAGKYGLLDGKAKEILPPDFDYIYPWYAGNMTWFTKDKKCGYIDMKGKEVIPAKFDGADPFYTSSAVVRNGNKYALIDTTGKTIYEPGEGFEIRYWTDGFYHIISNRKYGLINRKGKILLECKYEYIGKNIDTYVPGDLRVKENGVEKNITVPVTK